MLLISCIVFSQITTTLDGSASFDPDGTIATYTWRQITGLPVTIVNANSKIATITFTNPGVYSFGLIVKDNLGLVSAEDTVKITVNPGNQKPKADAGADQFITLPSNTFRMSAIKDREFVFTLPKRR